MEDSLLTTLLNKLRGTGTKPVSPDFKPILGSYKKPKLTPTEEEIKKTWSELDLEQGERQKKDTKLLQELSNTEADLRGKERENLYPSLSVGKDWPAVPTPVAPPLYPTNTSASLARPVADLLKIYPSLARRLGTIQAGPDTGCWKCHG